MSQLILGIGRQTSEPMQLRSTAYNLREFSESVTELDTMQILDAVLAEIHAIKMQCRSLGFGAMPKKGSLARKYIDDLSAIVQLFTDTTPPQFRPGFIEEAWPMLGKLSQQLVALSTLKGKGAPHL